MKGRNISSALVTKERLYERLFKHASRVSSEFDDETLEMIQLLHKTRDEHVSYTKSFFFVCLLFLLCISFFI